jgi:hypothetical protein
MIAPISRGDDMRLHFCLTVALAALAVSCTTEQHQEETAQTVRSTPSSAPSKVIRCASANDLQPQSDPCSGKTMAGQRVPRG